MPAPLDYAPPELFRSRWGPFWFFPTWRSWILIALIIPCVQWVKRFHEPWGVVSTIHQANYVGTHASSGPILPFFTSDGYLISLDDDWEIRSRDPQTGKIVANLHSAIPAFLGTNRGYDLQVFPLHGGRELLIFENARPKGLVIETKTGKLLRETINLSLRDAHNIEVNDDASRVITNERQRIGEPRAYPLLWDLTPPTDPQNQLPIKSLSSRDAWARLDNCGKWISIPADVRLIESKSLKDISLPFPYNDNDWLHQIVGPYLVIVPGPQTRGLRVAAHVNTTLNAYDIITGRKVASFPVQFASPTRIYPRLSTDLSQIALIMSDQNELRQVTLWDLVNGRVLGSAEFNSPQFKRKVVMELKYELQNYSHLSYFDSAYNGVCLVAIPGQQPFTVFPTANRLIRFGLDHKSAVLFDDSNATLFRRSRPECRESRFGALGMPHVWLLLTLTSTLTFSLLADARRHRREPRPLLPIPIFAILALAALIASLHMLLSILIDKTYLTPAPIILLCCITLFTHSRFHALLATLFLTASAGWFAYLAKQHLPLTPSPTAPTRLWIADRLYDIPYALPVLLLASAAALCLVSAIFLTLRLLRRPIP